MNKAPLLARILAPLFVLCIVGCTWHLAVDFFKIPAVVLPKPEAVLRGMWTERIPLLKGAWVTFQAAFLGLLCSALIGTLVAMLFSQSAWIRTALYPYVLFLQTVPIVAIAPLLIIIQLEEFNYDAAAAIGIAMLLISFAMLLVINLIQVWSRRRIGYV
jgi:NitT/TauT family transport system permease protein